MYRRSKSINNAVLAIEIALDSDSKIQQYQQQQQQKGEPSEISTLQNSLNAKDEQIVQLQNQIQTQQETHRLGQEQKEQLQAHNDTLKEEIRYVHLHLFSKTVSLSLLSA